MNNSNPYTPTQAPAGSRSKDVVKHSTRSFEIFHNAFRGLLAFFCFGFTPIFVLPQFKNFFEEFGIDLSVIGQLILQFSDVACIAPIAFLPFSFVVFAAIECGIFFLPSGRPKTLINVTYWLVLVLVIGSAFFAFMNILTAITSSLTAITNPTPSLLRF